MYNGFLERKRHGCTQVRERNKVSCAIESMRRSKCKITRCISLRESFEFENKFWGFTCQNRDLIMKHVVGGGSEGTPD